MVAGRLLQRLTNAGRVIACSALLVSCAQIHNDPINQPLLTATAPSVELGAGVETYYDDTVVALSFSGGGTRAAAFSYGVLTGFDEAPTPGRAASLLRRAASHSGPRRSGSGTSHWQSSAATAARSGCCARGAPNGEAASGSPPGSPE